MANLGICQRCSHCLKISRALVDENDRKLSASQVACDLADLCLVEWDSEVPETCPFRLEHLVTKDDVADLAEEAEKIRSHKEPR